MPEFSFCFLKIPAILTEAQKYDQQIREIGLDAARLLFMLTAHVSTAILAELEGR